MKKEMSVFDVRSIIGEMAMLKDGHIDKIFQWDFNVLFRVNVKDHGKVDLFFREGKWLYLPENKPETPITPQSFATFLRKYIDNARIGNTYQAGTDRIIITELFKAEKDYKLVFELFGGGNVLLILDGKIENCLVHKVMKDRIVKPGETYVMPGARFDPATADYDQFKERVKTSDADAVRTLATMINLGGQYAEEVCKRSNIDKKEKSSELSEDKMKILYENTKSIMGEMGSPDAYLYKKDGKTVDVSPIDMTIYSDYEKISFESLSKAIDSMLGENKEEEIEKYVDPEEKKLRKRIEKQKETVDEYRAKANDYKAKGDLLYAEYQKISELLKVLSEQSKKLNWEQLKEGAKKIDFVESINPSKTAVVAIIGDSRIELDYRKGIDANASDIYAKGKEFSEKADKAETALKESEELLAKKEKNTLKIKTARANKAQPTKEFWFDRFKWFFTPSGKMVIAGRDAHSNDNVVKKHLKDEDVYAHADLHGAPSTVLKGGRDASEEDLREACAFALAQSKGWVAALSEGTAFWVYTDQVSKTPQAGEFIPRGAFIIRGKRNYEHHLPIELAVGEITYQNERKIMCGPVLSVSKMSSKYFIVKPGKEKGSKVTGLIAKEFNVPEEEVARILPPGNVEIVDKKFADSE